MTLPLRCFDLNLWSVFRPARSAEPLLQNSHFLQGLTNRDALVWALLEGSHGPPCTPAPAAACIQCFAQSSRLSVSGAPNPFHGIFRSRIERSRPPTNGNQYAVDRAVANFGIPPKPADRRSPNLLSVNFV